MNHRWKERSSYEAHSPRNKRWTTCARCGMRVKRVLVKTEVRISCNASESLTVEKYEQRLVWMIQDFGWRWNLPRCGPSWMSSGT